MFIQIAICSAIYIAFYTVKNSTYIFSENFLKQSKEILSYDINVQEVFENISAWITKLSNEEKSENNDEDKNEQDSNTQATINDEENNTNEISNTNEENSELNIPENIQIEETDSIAEDASSISEIASDAEIIKNNYSIIKPLIGTITSRFGVRNPTTPTVPKYHTGIDIAANTGTVFIAAMSGTVVQVSSEGDYGNHVKIMQDDVATLYAHCSKIYVNEGDQIEQGQEIGEVGATGNVTGPHLHFEIRKSDRYVDPDDILDF